MTRSVLLLAAMLVAAPVNAELLVEIIHSGTWQGASSIQPANLAFRAYEINEPNRPILGGEYTTDDVGSVFHASPETLAIMEPGLMANGHIDSVVMMSGAMADADQFIWGPGGPGVGAIEYVPRLGPGLTGYDITEITQTIDSLAWEQQGGTRITFDGFAQHTIRIYGDLTVPEPSSLLLIVSGAILFHARDILASYGRLGP